MTQEIFQVDAFANRVFSGNPAGVCILDNWLDDATMQNIAMENNLAETAFLVKKSKNEYDLRWFTPMVEVDLCGHATLASAHVLYSHYKLEDEELIFYSRSGKLIVKKIKQDTYQLDFPSDEAVGTKVNIDTQSIFGIPIVEIYEGKDDYIFVAENQEAVEKCSPNFRLVSQVGKRGSLLTSRGIDHDFVSRGFFPNVGIDEDPVTGSAHTLLTPFWAKRLNKSTLSAKQISKRGGEIECEISGDRVLLTGRAITYLKGEIYI